MQDIAMEADIEKPFELPHIPNDKRIIPNDMIRSSLFTIANHNCPRTYLKNQKVCSFRSTDIVYTGEELRQDDEDVWLQLVYIAAEAQKNEITFKPYTFLSQIGWPQRTQYRDRLKASLTRMSATTLEIYNHHFEKGIGFSLVRKFEWHNDDKKEKQLMRWRVWLEPEVIRLFSDLGKMYSKIHWEQRKKLKPLAKWLHAFYSSHAEPEPIHLLRLKELSGSKTKSLKHFKEIARDAFFELVQIRFLNPDVCIDERFFVTVSRVKEAYKQVHYG
ncbi:MAG: plasmid replication initiator TrfA [Gammaproteobacteria bacterium]|nr:plasmid replication initiator TrfA [Gammaproteobacteria bacterium]